MNHIKTLCLALIASVGAAATTVAQVPGIIQYQGRVTSNGTNFSGNGQFKFAIVENIVTGESLWSNDGTSVMGSQPSKQVNIQVQDGLFIVGLGDNTLGNMQTIPASIFSYQDLRLRIWFSDGLGGFSVLSPDQRITSVGFAMIAASVSDGAITSAKLASEAITGDKIAPNAVAGGHLLNQTITGSKISSNSITSAQIADTLTLQQLDLGSSLWNGTLNLWASGVNESRGLLAGDASGSLLNLKFANNNTGAVLSARSPGGRLNLWDGLGNETVLVGAGSGGGELTLFKLTGEPGIVLDGDRALYGNPSLGGSLSILDSGGNTTTVEILGAETTSSGSAMRMRRANGTTTMFFDAENDFAGNARVELYKGDGTSTVALLPGGGIATAGGGGLVRLGELDSTNLGIDDNGMLARSNNVASPLYLNWGYSAPTVMTRVAINTSTPATGYSLSVNGKVICEELVIQNSNEWPDYVFAENYNLQSLEEVEAHIRQNKHLPGIPNARQIGDAGIPLGEMQRQMMEKIEELTLYVIDQNKRLQNQQAELNSLRAQLSSAK